MVLNHTNAITRFLAHISNISACLLTWLMYYNTSNNTKNLEKKFRIRFRNWLQWWLIFVGTYLYLWMEFRLSLQILSINFVILSTQMVSTIPIEWLHYTISIFSIPEILQTALKKLTVSWVCMWFSSSLLPPNLLEQREHL